ncbi:hypothetical protein IKQ_00630 [Bacillus cereus VDM053]|nr:hypothetical protein IKQ_00630 [Bacillus cereus VDM053]
MQGVYEASTILLEKSNASQFDYLNKEAYKKYQSKFNIAELKLIRSGKNPKSYTWHHHQEPGDMQLVNTWTHQKTGHTGGRALWGK